MRHVGKEQHVAHRAAGRAAFGNNDFHRGPVNVAVIPLNTLHPSDEQYMNTYLERYRQLGLTGGSMSVTEIDTLSASLGQNFPPAFCAYLSLAGNSPPPKLIGSDCHGSHLSELYEAAIELLEENDGPFALPDNAVVFLMHQGYQFFYFVADGNNLDPPVYYYLEGKPVAERKYATFSDWVQGVAV